MNDNPRILVISHNVFSKSTAMGKTMSSMLSCVPPENLAQLYFHSEVPTTDVCKNYFRITDQNGTLLGTGTFSFYQMEQKINT